MAGSIIISSGFQRSGKTFIISAIAQHYYNRNVPVYTNMTNTNFINVNDLTQIPLDNKPKVLLLDEMHFFLNSRNFKSQGDLVYFLNTICKRNILLLGSTISPDMIDKNLRMQIHYFIIAKKDKNYLNYKIIDVQNQNVKLLTLQKSNQLFDYVDYNTNDIPNMFNFNIDKYIKLNENKNKFI